jgi:uncharacterized membrane protein
MAISSKKYRSNIFSNMHPLQRILISIVLSVIAYFLLSDKNNWLIKFTSSWIVFSAAYLTMCWMILFSKPIAEIRKTASKEDGSKWFVFLMVLISSCASMLAVLLLIISKDENISGSNFFLPATICGMILSWAMVHTLFAFHYAHDYYGNDENDKTKPAGGLDFPGTAKPDYLDFAYFSFVIGCTFQVSDVEISSRKIRRIAFLHQLISFALNTFVVALTINLIAGLSK